MQPILIIEDDADINALVAEILRRGGYAFAQAYSGSEARLLLERETFGLYILDRMLPGLPGDELIPLIRGRSAAPILILSAREAPAEKAALLRAGADDYLTKPFDGQELLARIEALLRRMGHGGGAPGETRHFRGIALDRAARQVRVEGVPVALTAREFDILELLMAHPHKVFTKANLYHSVWNDAFLGDDNTLNVHVSKIRAKLGGDYIQTVWGIGYKMREEPGT